MSEAPGASGARPTVSVLVPVKNGGALLVEQLAAVIAQSPHEYLITDSGSTDGSVEAARAAGATVIEIDPATFKHGPTRNLLAERATGDVLAFLTQDATPVPGWLDAITDAFAADEHLGALFGPHLPRPSTSVMIARELTEYFATFAGPDGPDDPREFGASDATFLSNVNAAYRRACWAEIRFEDLAYSEDQAFGRTLAASDHWHKRYDPAAAVLHAHDFPPGEFFKRYFDEYRGLMESVGHVEPLGLKPLWRQVKHGTRADLRWVRDQQVPGGEAKWRWPIVRHHALRHLGAGLGGRAHRLPPSLEKRFSLEGRVSDRTVRPELPQQTTPHRGAEPQIEPVEASRDIAYEAIGEVFHDGPAPLTGDAWARAERDALHLAFVIPPFRIGSGGHMSIFRLIEHLESVGHQCTIWVVDPLMPVPDPPAVMRHTIREHFRPLNAPVFSGLSEWFGADVAVATGWQTVHPTLRLPDCASRAYLVHDYETEFYAASAERLFAEDTFKHGLHAVCSSPWLADISRERGATTDVFDFGVDHEIYAGTGSPRSDNTIAFYARHETARRGVALGVLALEEILEARPDVDIVQFGTHFPMKLTSPTRSASIASPSQLADLYSTSTVGLCLSLTNYSLIPKEMLACGLPCVDLAHPSSVSVFGQDGPVSFADETPKGIASAVLSLLDDAALRERRSAEGVRFVKDLTWSLAGRQVEAGLRRALVLQGEQERPGVGRAATTQS